MLQIEDMKHIGTFAPQESLKYLNAKIVERLRSKCIKEGHIPKLSKIAEITDTRGEFEELQWGYVCRVCDQRLRPIAFEGY